MAAKPSGDTAWNLQEKSRGNNTCATELKHARWSLWLAFAAKRAHTRTYVAAGRRPQARGRCISIRRGAADPPHAASLSCPPVCPLAAAPALKCGGWQRRGNEGRRRRALCGDGDIMHAAIIHDTTLQYTYPVVRAPRRAVRICSIPGPFPRAPPRPEETTRRMQMQYTGMCRIRMAWCSAVQCSL
jgi:hypothetical protein